MCLQVMIIYMMMAMSESGTEGKERISGLFETTEVSPQNSYKPIRSTSLTIVSLLVHTSLILLVATPHPSKQSPAPHGKTGSSQNHADECPVSG